MAGRSKQPAAASSNVRRRKRSQPPVYSSLTSSYDDKDNDYVCPICFEMIDEAYMTKCGHSFCQQCILQSLEHSNRCPRCGFVIEKKDDLFPNLTLNELIQKEKQKLSEQKRFKLSANFTATEAMELLGEDNLDLTKVTFLMDILAKQKEKLEGENLYAQYQLLGDFLNQVEEKKQKQMDGLNKELSLIAEDKSKVQEKLKEQREKYPLLDGTLVNGLDANIASSSTDTGAQDGFNGSKNGGRPWLYTTMAARRKKVNSHFDDLESCYFSTRHAPVNVLGGTAAAEDNCDNLEEFNESLSKFTRFSSFRNLATLNYASDIYNNSSIVSSIEFDRDCDFFAIAGVTKKIKVFEYNTVILEHVDMHYPVHEMLCNSKISSVIWSQYHKNLLASSDYEGTVTLWDAFTGQKSRLFQEHEKRCWSVDFNRMDPKLLASGSDDSRVKLWYTNMEHSMASIEAKANVCCVKFNPESRYHLAFGSADHCVHYYDLRNTRQPLQIFKGHRKAVSYAKFVNTNQVVSASTDSQLKLWNLSKPHCLRTFRGHINEKNFVGLATDGDYVACGSENNSLYVYYRGLSKHLMTYKFDTVRNVLEKDKKEEDANEFVSAVCWRPGSNVVVAANSQGIIKVLELT